jgi:hypothetical protein
MQLKRQLDWRHADLRLCPTTESDHEPAYGV